MPHLPSKRRRKVYSVRVWPTRFRPPECGTSLMLAAARREAEAVRRLSGELMDKGDAYWAEQVAIQGEEAGGWLAFAELRSYDALRLLRVAADHEDAAEKHPVTPSAVRPARELLGDLLM